MSYKFTELPYLFNTAPDELRSTIIRTLDKNKGHVQNTAADLDITRRMFLHYVERLDLRPEVDGIKDKWKGERQRLRAGRSSALAAARYNGTSSEGVFLESARKAPDVAKDTMRWAFEEAGGDAGEACRLLGVRRSTLWNTAEALGIYEDLRDLTLRLREARAGSLSDLRQRLNSRPAASATTGASDSRSE